MWHSLESNKVASHNFNIVFTRHQFHSWSKTIQAWICSTSHVETLPWIREWKSHFFCVAYWIYPLLKYYFLGCLTYFFTLINFEGARCPSCWRATQCNSNIDKLVWILRYSKCNYLWFDWSGGLSLDSWRARNMLQCGLVQSQWLV